MYDISQPVCRPLSQNKHLKALQIQDTQQLQGEMYHNVELINVIALS